VTKTELLQQIVRDRARLDEIVGGLSDAELLAPGARTQ
jgi:hypothetical protein